MLERFTLEEPVIDRIKAWFIDGESPQRAVGRDHRSRRLRSHIALRSETEAVTPNRLDFCDARNRSKPPLQPASVCFHFDNKSGAQYLASEVADSAHQYNATGL